MKQVELKIVVKNDDKLLEYLLNNIKDKSKNNIKSLLKNKNISVNGVTTTQFDYELNKNDIICIRLKEISGMKKKDNMEILYEDEYLIIVNKNSGLLTVGTIKEKERTLYHYVSEYVKKDNRKNKIFIVNRLDKDTSGIVVFAKSEKIKEMMQDNWDKSVLLKNYIAVVEGVTDGHGIIKSYLEENKEHMVYSTNNKSGKFSITEYTRIKCNKKYSLLEIKLHTGRKNQIRVHMKDIKHPIIGDSKYGNNSNPINRLGLHASRLIFIHPISNKNIDIKCSVPTSFYNLF